MVDDIKKAALENIIKLEVIPIERMAELKADIDKVASDNAINGFQKWIIEKKYIYAPEVDFEVKSIVAAVWPQRVVKLVFRYRGKNCFLYCGRRLFTYDRTGQRFKRAL